MRIALLENTSSRNVWNSARFWPGFPMSLWKPPSTAQTRTPAWPSGRGHLCFEEEHIINATPNWWCACRAYWLKKSRTRRMRALDPSSLQPLEDRTFPGGGMQILGMLSDWMPEGVRRPKRRRRLGRKMPPHKRTHVW